MLSDVCDAGHEEFSTGLSSCLSCRRARCSHEALVGLRGAWRWGFAVARVQCVGRGLLIAPFLGFPYLILLSFFKFACLGADCREGEGAARPMAGATLPPAGFPKSHWEHGFGACSRGSSTQTCGEDGGGGPELCPSGGNAGNEAWGLALHCPQNCQQLPGSSRLFLGPSIHG